MSTNTDKIDAAINAAKKRVAAKGGNTKTTGDKPKRKRLTAEEREARDKARAEAKAQREAEREAARAAKIAEREANRKPAHMAKVEKAAEKLPPLTDNAQEFLTNATEGLTPAEVFTLAEHFKHFVRVQRTQAALEMELGVGDTVRIKSGHPRFVGETGTVMKAQRIRCYVEVPGYDKQVYLFTSDVEVLQKAADGDINTVPADTEEPVAATG